VAGKKVVFVAFAKEDQSARNLLKGQSLSTKSPFEYVDMSVKEPYDTTWKTRTRTRIKRSDGVIALISKNTSGASGELWEIGCAREEGRPLMGIWLGAYRTKPKTMGNAPCRIWTWPNLAGFIDSL
jgi:nucleoside 2-deoxyribosyltransferase